MNVERDHFVTTSSIPGRLVWGALFLIIANLGVTLLGQPIEYWLVASHDNVSQGHLQNILPISPILFVLLGLVYAAILGLLWRRLPHHVGVGLWFIVAYVHLYDLVNWLKCHLDALIPIPSGYNCQTDYFILWLLASLFVGGLLATLWATARPAATETSRVWPVLGKGFALLLGVVAALLLAIGLVRTVAAARVGWRPVVSAHQPDGRYGASIAYDTQRGQAVLFGGSNNTGNPNSTWEWDGTDWHQRFPATSPPGRHAQAMAYDEARGVVVLFGGDSAGESLEGVWEWDGTNWRVIYPESGPARRCCHKLIYDPVRGRVVLYGGIAAGVFYEDAWEWDGTNWHSIPLENQAILSSGSGMAYDYAHQQVVGFSGVTENATWLWQGNRWLNPVLALQPPGRHNAPMTFDFQRQQIVLHSGGKDGLEYNDTWLFDGQSWQQLELPRSPVARTASSLFYDYQRQRVMLFGGHVNGQPYNDLWELQP
jgi:hypothetical protein